MSTQTVKTWLAANALPTSIEDEFKQFNIETIDQIKSKSTKEINVMIDYLVKDPCIKPQSNLAVSFRSAIMDLLLSKGPITPQKQQMKAVGVFSEQLVTDIAAYKAGKLQPKPINTKRNVGVKKANKIGRKPAINLTYLPLYKCAYLTYCSYMKSYHIPKEYVEIDNFKYMNKLQKFSGKVEVNEPFNLWAISYDPSNPKRAMYKSYKKICNTIYYTKDDKHLMEKSLKLYQRKGGFISRRRKQKYNNKKSFKSFKKPVYKWNEKGANSAQSGYFTKQQTGNNFTEIEKFIPAIYKYKNKSEFEKAEYLLCWERLKNNEKTLDEHYTSVKWTQSFNYLYNIELKKIEKEIIEMNMQTHKLRLKFFKLINKSGVKNAIETYKKEYNNNNCEEKELNESDNEIVYDLDIELESKTPMEPIENNEIKNIIEICENECENEEFEENNNENVNDKRRLSSKLVVTSKNETFVTEAGLSNAEEIVIKQ